MTTEEIIEGNKLIAEFMSIEVTEYVTYSPTAIYKRNLEYYSSWDWLMPVVDKISKWAYENKELYNKYFWQTPYHEDFLIFRIEIEKLWLAVVEFIKWYNNQKEE